MAELDDVPVDELMNENDDKAALQMFKYGNRQQVCFKFYHVLFFQGARKRVKRKRIKRRSKKIISRSTSAL